MLKRRLTPWSSAPSSFCCAFCPSHWRCTISRPRNSKIPFCSCAASCSTAGARCGFFPVMLRSSSSTTSAAWGLSASSRTRPPVSSCCSSRWRAVSGCSSTSSMQISCSAASMPSSAPVLRPFRASASCRWASASTPSRHFPTPSTSTAGMWKRSITSLISVLTSSCSPSSSPAPSSSTGMSPTASTSTKAAMSSSRSKTA